MRDKGFVVMECEMRRWLCIYPTTVEYCILYCSVVGEERGGVVDLVNLILFVFIQSTDDAMPGRVRRDRIAEDMHD